MGSTSIRRVGVPTLVAASGMPRGTVYKAFGPGRQPTLDTFLTLVRAMGLELCVKAPVAGALDGKDPGAIGQD